MYETRKFQMNSTPCVVLTNVASSVAGEVVLSVGWGEGGRRRVTREFNSFTSESKP